jgi:hypothetical protein
MPLPAWAHRGFPRPGIVVSGIDKGMIPLLTFTEFLTRKNANEPAEADRAPDPVAERSITGGMFKAVNPARPVSPLNSRLLAGPFPRKLKSQVIGR